MTSICNASRGLAIICLLMTAKASGYQEKKMVWDPVFAFQIQWILNAGLPEARLSLNRPSLKTFYLKDGNVLVGKTEVDTDSFFVIQIGQDFAEKNPVGENILVFKRDIRSVK